MKVFFEILLIERRQYFSPYNPSMNGPEAFEWTFEGRYGSNQGLEVKVDPFESS
jgi:hypothetical protein